MRTGILFFLIFISRHVFAADFVTSTGENPPYQIHQLVQDGAWTWFNDERVIVELQILYIGSIDSLGRVRVDLFSLASPFGHPPESEYILSSWRSRDDHNNPALLKLADGKILAAYTKHHLEPKLYRRLADIDASGRKLTWSQEIESTTEAKTTYSNLFQLSDENGRIYNFIRATGFNPNFLYSDDMAETWSGPFVLIKSGDNRTRPYVKYSGNGKDRIDFLYTDGHPRDVPDNSVYHIYYKNGNFYRSDGTFIKTLEQVEKNPLIPSDGTKIYDGASESGRGWVWDLEYDTQGNPVAAYINSADHAEGKDLRYRYAYWDEAGKKWLDRQIAFAGTHLYVPENHYAGGIAIDPADTGTVYISADVDPADGKASPSGHYQIYRGEISRDSQNPRWQQLTFDTDADNFRPIVPRGHGCKICLIWLRGQYKTYTNYKTSIVGIIDK
ncbi:MAG: BNR-4 repeat-containing protein [Sedimentisphaerales bacterium]|nr:BNR-4 repeat-containing protein [Sedimentisphaerales bacterium]